MNLSMILHPSLVLRVEALSRTASRARMGGCNAADWMLSWYEPDCIPREEALDEMNDLMSRIAGWCWAPPRWHSPKYRGWDAEA